MDGRVVTVGAGPTGLMIAGKLRLPGAGVIVSEPLPEPTGESRGDILVKLTGEGAHCARPRVPVLETALAGRHDTFRRLKPNEHALSMLLHARFRYDDSSHCALQTPS